MLQLVGVLRVSTLKSPSSGKKESPEHQHRSSGDKGCAAGASLSPLPSPATSTPITLSLHSPSPGWCAQTDPPVAHNNDDDDSDEEHQPCRGGADDERQLLLDTGLVLGWHARKRKGVTGVQDGSTPTSSSRSEHGPEHRPTLVWLLLWGGFCPGQLVLSQASAHVAVTGMCPCRKAGCSYPF